MSALVTASPAAVAAAQEKMDCRRSNHGLWCVSHNRGSRTWTDRGCAQAVAIADAVTAVADEEQAARWEELKELAQQVADTRRRAEAAEAEVERLTRECLDREATETDARERLRRCEERLAKLDGLAQSAIQAEADAVRQLEDTLAAVAALHVRTPTDGGPDYCPGCSRLAQEWVKWPCPTGAVLPRD